MSSDSGEADRQEILKNDVLLRLWLRNVGFRSPRRIVFTLAVSILPLFLLAWAASAESRLKPGSVGEVVDGNWVNGMSFLGDTMVWPFLLFIPLLMIALNASVRRTRKFFGELEGVLRTEWLETERVTYDRLLAESRRILRAEGGWKWVRRIAIAVGVGLFVLNTVMCAFPHDIGGYARKVGGERLIIEKWDTNRAEAPLSWYAARAWVLLLGYFWVPLVIYKLLNLMASIRHMLRGVSRAEGAFQIRPLHPDRSAGLAPVSKAAFSLGYPVVVITLMVAVQFFKENAEPGLHNYLVVPLFLSFIVLVLWLPLSEVHRAMVRTRAGQMGELSTHYDRLRGRFREKLCEEDVVGEDPSVAESLRAVREEHECLQKMPVWPFAVSSLLRIGTAAAVPVLMVLAKAVLPALLKAK